jgi:hypothetical protein
MGQTYTFGLANTSLDPECAGTTYWYIFLLSSLLTFFGGLFIIVLWRCIKYFFHANFTVNIKNKVRIFEMIDFFFNFLCCHPKKIIKNDPIKASFNENEYADNEIGFVTYAKDFCGELISGLNCLFCNSIFRCFKKSKFIGQSSPGRILVSFTRYALFKSFKNN